MEGNSRPAKRQRLHYVRFPLNMLPQQLERFRSACAANGTEPAAEIKRFIAEYCEQGGRMPEKTPEN